MTGPRFVVVHDVRDAPTSRPRSVVLDTETGRGRAYDWPHFAAEVADRFNAHPSAPSLRMSAQVGKAARAVLDSRKGPTHV